MKWVPLLNIVLTVLFYALFPVLFPLFLMPKTGPMALKGYVTGGLTDTIAASLSAAVDGNQDTMVVISADAAASHQSVINVMDAARRAGLVQITFATQQSGSAPSRGKS